MIRTTDAMIKAMNVMKAKESLADTLDAQEKARKAGRTDLEEMFCKMVDGCKKEIEWLECLLRNPAA